MLDCRREPSKGVRCCRIRSFLSNLASITGTRSSLSPGPTTAQKLTTSSIYQQVTKTSQGPTQRAKRSLAAWQEQVPKTDEGGMQNRCATRKELELQSFQRWIASSCPGGRGWVYHGELRCHSRLASQNRSTTKSSYGRISTTPTLLTYLTFAAERYELSPVGVDKYVKSFSSKDNSLP